MDTAQNFDIELKALAEAIASEQAILDKEVVANPTLDKEKIHSALKEQISELLPQSAPASATDDSTVPPPPSTSTGQVAVKKGQVGSKSYLDTVDDATVAKVNAYVAEAFKNGIQHTLRQVITEDPFLLDVFHDALTDKLYGELKNRGLVK